MHRWLKPAEQRKRLQDDGCRVVLDLDKSSLTRADLMRLVREGTVVKLVYVFLLADPVALRKKGGLKADFMDVFTGLVDKRQAVVRDLSTGLASDTKETRRALIALAGDQISRSNQGLKSAENGNRSPGRPKRWVDPIQRQVIWDEWHSSVHRTNGEAAQTASKRLGLEISANTMWRIVKEERAKRGVAAKGASGRRPNVKALQIASAGVKRQGSIYFLKNGRRQQIKIGYSSAYKERLSTIQLSTPENLRLVALIPGDRDLERELHKRFEKYHVRGEWFKVEGKLATYLRGLPNPKQFR